MCDENEDAMSDENIDYMSGWTSGQTYIYWDFKRYPVPNNDLHADIIMDILNERIRKPTDRFDRHDIVLVTKQEQVYPVDRELLRIVECLASRDHKVWLLAPPEQGDVLGSYEVVLRSMRAIQGKTRPQSSASHGI